MVDDVLPKLLKSVRQDFEKYFGESDVVTKAFAELQAKKVTYKTVNEFAIEVGRLLSLALTGSVSSDKLPDGKMYYNIAKRLLDETMGRNYKLISGYAGDVQRILNENAQIGLKVQRPPLNRDKVNGMVNRLDSENTFDDVKWLFGEPIVNFSQSIVDDTIKANADLQYKTGMTPQVVRTESGNCCEWCREVVGTYSYPKVPKDVWRRHQRCRCTLDYDPKNGKVQSAWSKIWRKKEKTQESIERVEKFKESALVESIKNDIAKLDMTKVGPSDIIDIGKRINYHFRVSEHIGDKEKLKEIFSNFREIGGEIPKNTWAKGSSKLVKDQLQEAFQNYPTEWAAVPDGIGKKLKAIKRKRGYFDGYDEDLVIATNGTRKTTPYHEIGHMIELVNPDLVRLEKAWVDKRTANEAEVRLKDIFPSSNYGIGEVTKKDDFISPYIGKYYSDAAEVFTMGLQGIFVPEERFAKSFDKKTWKYDYKTINDDPEFLNFIIGLFVKV
ncbi:TPA: hypothetical protein VJE84_000796 [Streptococcus pyogenes]|uniref:hypothetical protein n=1 Tax=Streptococcus pyogenes TaxID=1314 RepID=UPI000DA3A776|nr:hypothetical protein [Streptococcus pyogenes]SQF44645.1 phage protein [Streptococcus pyogenes]HER0920713.1 hypothetical protein [Streptococcus pyogenes]HER2948126.1 hypothetical protein [Streptococcus pyogenes]